MSKLTQLNNLGLIISREKWEIYDFDPQSRDN